MGGESPSGPASSANIVAVPEGDVNPGEAVASERSGEPSPARGVFLGMAGRAVYFAAGYLASLVLARRLGPADYGIYGIVMSVLLCIEQIGKFTFAPAVAKLIPERGAGARRRRDGLVAELHLLRHPFRAVVVLGAGAGPHLRPRGAGHSVVSNRGGGPADLLDDALSRSVLLGRREFFLGRAPPTRSIR